LTPVSATIILFKLLYFVWEGGKECNEKNYCGLFPPFPCLGILMEEYKWVEGNTHSSPFPQNLKYSFPQNWEE